MKKTFVFFITLSLMFLLNGMLTAQSRAYTVKGGLTIGTQKWDNSFQRDPLYSYHGIFAMESAPEENIFALFAQIGYHVKGSAIRTFATQVQTATGLRSVPARTTPFKFKNISLTLGAKQKYDFMTSSKAYYLIGIRGDYTVGTQLRPDWLEDPNDPGSLSSYAIFYPFDAYVRKFNYGATFGGGLEFPVSEFVSTIIEFTVNPDFSRQYDQPTIPNVISPNPNSTNNTTLNERQIRNITFELTVGFRFLHKIEYID